MGQRLLLGIIGWVEHVDRRDFLGFLDLGDLVLLGQGFVDRLVDGECAIQLEVSNAQLGRPRIICPSDSGLAVFSSPPSVLWTWRAGPSMRPLRWRTRTLLG